MKKLSCFSLTHLYIQSFLSHHVLMSIKTHTLVYLRIPAEWPRSRSAPPPSCPGGRAWLRPSPVRTPCGQTGDLGGWKCLKYESPPRDRTDPPFLLEESQCSHFKHISTLPQHFSTATCAGTDERQICQRPQDGFSHLEYSRRMDFAGVLVVHLDPENLHTSPPSPGTRTAGTGSCLSSHSLEQTWINMAGAHCWAHVHSEGDDGKRKTCLTKSSESRGAVLQGRRSVHARDVLDCTVSRDNTTSFTRGWERTGMSFAVCVPLWLHPFETSRGQFLWGSAALQRSAPPRPAAAHSDEDKRV